MFYRKSKLQKKTHTNSFTDFISKNTKVKISFEMIKNGANANEVFQKMDLNLDDHLQRETRILPNHTESKFKQIEVKKGYIW